MENATGDKRKAEIMDYVHKRQVARVSEEVEAIKRGAQAAEDPDDIGRRKLSNVQYDSKTLKVQYLEKENQEALEKIKYLDEMLLYMVEVQNDTINSHNLSAGNKHASN